MRSGLNADMAQATWETERMWIRTEAFHVSKRGNDESEYEDAFYPSAVERAQHLDLFDVTRLL